MGQHLLRWLVLRKEVGVVARCLVIPRCPVVRPRARVGRPLPPVHSSKPFPSLRVAPHSTKECLVVPTLACPTHWVRMHRSVRTPGVTKRVGCGDEPVLRPYDRCLVLRRPPMRRVGRRRGRGHHFVFDPPTDVAYAVGRLPLGIRACKAVLGAGRGVRGMPAPARAVGAAAAERLAPLERARHADVLHPARAGARGASEVVGYRLEKLKMCAPRAHGGARGGAYNIHKS